MSYQARSQQLLPLLVIPVIPCQPDQPASADGFLCLHAGSRCTICPGSDYENYCSGCTVSEDNCLVSCSICALVPIQTGIGPQDIARRQRKLSQSGITAVFATPLNITEYGGTCRVDFCPDTAEGNGAASINPQCVAVDCADEPICTGNDHSQFTDTGNYGFFG